MDFRFGILIIVVRILLVISSEPFQENDPGEIQWDQFSLPELKNFLLILDREEAWYKRKIHEKYETVENLMNKLVEEKRPKLALVEEAETEREKEWL